MLIVALKAFDGGCSNYHEHVNPDPPFPSPPEHADGKLQIFILLLYKTSYNVVKSALFVPND